MSKRQETACQLTTFYLHINVKSAGATKEREKLREHDKLQETQSDLHLRDCFLIRITPVFIHWRKYLVIQHEHFLGVDKLWVNRVPAIVSSSALTR